MGLNRKQRRAAKVKPSQYCWKDLPPDALQLYRAVVEAWPEGANFRKLSGMTMEELMTTVDELRNIGVLELQCVKHPTDPLKDQFQFVLEDIEILEVKREAMH